MGRLSKLTSKQKAEIGRRLASGETQRALAKEFGVSNGTIGSLFVGRSTTLKTLARTVAEAEQKVELLSIPEQVIVRDMADQYKSMSQDYTRGASTSLNTATELHQIAAQKVSELDRTNLQTEDLRLVAALTDTANKASQMSTNLMNLNKNNTADQAGNLTVVSGVPHD